MAANTTIHVATHTKGEFIYNLFTLNSALNISLVNATLSLWKMAQRRTKYVRGKVTWYVGMPHLTWCEGKGPGT